MSFMQSVTNKLIMLIVFLLSVVMLNVVAPPHSANQHQHFHVVMLSTTFFALKLTVFRVVIPNVVAPKCCPLETSLWSYANLLLKAVFFDMTLLK